MKKMIFAISFTTIQFASPSLFAAENVQIIEAPKAIYSDSSEFHRMNKTFSLNYIATGVGPNSSVSTGATLGFFIDRNSLIDLEYVSGRPYQIDWALFSDYEIKTQSAGVHFKHFVGNSFYFRVGADYRQVDYRRSYRGLFSNTVTSVNKFTADSVTATVLIGNQWQWDNFTLGCDWIGVALPVTSKIKTESVEGSDPDASFLKEDEDTLVKRNTTMGLRLYLGASF